MDRKAFAEKLGVRDNTIIFVLLSVVTCLFYYYYWALNFVKTILVGNEAKKFSIFVIVIASLQFFNLSLPADDVNLAALTGLLSLVNFVLLITVSVMLKKHVEAYFAANGYAMELSTFCCIVFGFYYFYYKSNQIRLGANATKGNQTFDEQLKALHDLKAQGVITDEEFEAKKTQILNDVK